MTHSVFIFIITVLMMTHACAAVMVRILEDYSLLNLDEVEECFEMEIGHLTPDTHLKCKKNKKKQKKNSKKKAVNE